MLPKSESSLPRTNPRIRVLSFQNYLEEIKAGIVEVLGKNEVQKQRYDITIGEPFSVKNERNEDPLVVPLFLTINTWEIVRDLGAMITLGRALLDIVKYLQARRDEKKIHRFTINCSATYYLALDFLRTHGVTIGRPVYFHSFGYECLMISDDSKRPRVFHVVIFSNEGELSDYTVL